LLEQPVIPASITNTSVITVIHLNLLFMAFYSFYMF
jgi:hypothetical protein